MKKNHHKSIFALVLWVGMFHWFVVVALAVLIVHFSLCITNLDKPLFTSVLFGKFMSLFKMQQLCQTVIQLWGLLSKNTGITN